MTTNHPDPTHPPAEPAPSLHPVEELQALCDAASPGPWTQANPDSVFVKCSACDQGEYVANGIESRYGKPHHSPKADAEFIAAARTALPSLLARLRAAEETLAAVGAVLAAKEAELRANTLLPTVLVESAIRSGDYKINARDIRAALAEGASR